MKWFSTDRDMLASQTHDLTSAVRKVFKIRAHSPSRLATSQLYSHHVHKSQSMDPCQDTKLHQCTYIQHRSSALTFIDFFQPRYARTHQLNRLQTIQSKFGYSASSSSVAVSSSNSPSSSSSSSPLSSSSSSTSSPGMPFHCT